MLLEESQTQLMGLCYIQGSIQIVQMSMAPIGAYTGTAV